MYRNKNVFVKFLITLKFVLLNLIIVVSFVKSENIYLHTFHTIVTEPHTT